MKNLFTNTDIAENFDRRIQVEKLTPIGKKILETYIPVRVDEKTIKLVKPENFPSTENEKVSRKRKEKDNRK